MFYKYFLIVAWVSSQLWSNLDLDKISYLEFTTEFRSLFGKRMPSDIFYPIESLQCLVVFSRSEVPSQRGNIRGNPLSFFLNVFTKSYLIFRLSWYVIYSIDIRLTGVSKYPFRGSLVILFCHRSRLKSTLQCSISYEVWRTSYTCCSKFLDA